MIALEKYYGKLKTEELVEIIESQDKYKSEVIEYCKVRLDEMKVSKELLKDFSRKALKKRFYKYFTDGKYRSNEIINIDSFFLNTREAKICFEISKEEYIKYLDGATRNLPI